MASRYLQNFLASLETQAILKKNTQLDNFRTFLEHLPPKSVSKQQPARFIQSPIIFSRPLAGVFSLQSGCSDGASLGAAAPFSPGCPGKLHLLPEI